MNTLRDDSIVWDAKDIRSACHALWQTAYIYRRVKVPDPTTPTRSGSCAAGKPTPTPRQADPRPRGLQRQQVQPRIKLTRRTHEHPHNWQSLQRLRRLDMGVQSVTGGRVSWVSDVEPGRARSLTPTIPTSPILATSPPSTGRRLSRWM